jgi:uncharacterized damage-inducible protein DinB
MKMLAPLIPLLAGSLLAAPLTQGERDRAMSELHATRKQLLDAVAGLTPAQWNFKPSPSAWSIAEITEHLALTEDLIYDTVTKKIMTSPAQPDRQAETKGKDELILRTIPDRSKKAKAPAALTPSHHWASPKEAVEHFRAGRDRTIAYVRTTNDDLRAHFMEHPAVGLIDAYQWFLLDAGHTARHVAQIAEVKAAPGYPRR